MTAKTRKTAEPTALEVEDQIFEEIKAAQLMAGKVTQATAQADIELREADQDVADGMDGVVRGEEGSEERLNAANERQRQARAQRVALEPQWESCQRVIRSGRVKLGQLRELHLAEFAGEAEEYVSEVEQAAEELTPAVQKYLDTWERAQARWNSLGPAVRAKVLADDQEHGWLRSDSRVSHDCLTPECPIDASLLNDLTNVTPRPPAMASDYDPDPFAPAPADVSPPLAMPDGTPIYFENKVG